MVSVLWSTLRAMFLITTGGGGEGVIWDSYALRLRFNLRELSEKFCDFLTIKFQLANSILLV